MNSIKLGTDLQTMSGYNHYYFDAACPTFTTRTTLTSTASTSVTAAAATPRPSVAATPSTSTPTKAQIAITKETDTTSGTSSTTTVPTTTGAAGAKVNGQPDFKSKNNNAPAVSGEFTADQAVGKQGNSTDPTDIAGGSSDAGGRGAVLGVSISAVLLFIVAIIIALFLVERKRQSRESIDLREAKIHSTARHSTSAPFKQTNSSDAFPKLYPRSTTNSKRLLARPSMSSLQHQHLQRQSSESLYGGAVSPAHRQSSLLLRGRLSTNGSPVMHRSDNRSGSPVEHTYTDPVGRGFSANEYDQCDDTPLTASSSSFAENAELYYSTIKDPAEAMASTAEEDFDPTYQSADGASARNRPNSYVDFSGVMGSQHGKHQRPLSRQYTYEVPDSLKAKEHKGALYEAASVSSDSATVYEEAMASGVLYQGASGEGSKEHEGALYEAASVSSDSATVYEEAMASGVLYQGASGEGSKEHEGALYEAASVSSDSAAVYEAAMAPHLLPDHADHNVNTGGSESGTVYEVASHTSESLRYAGPSYDVAGESGASADNGDGQHDAPEPLYDFSDISQTGTSAAVGAYSSAAPGLVRGSDLSAALNNRTQTLTGARNSSTASTTPNRMSSVPFPIGNNNNAVARESFDPTYDLPQRGTHDALPVPVPVPPPTSLLQQQLYESASANVQQTPLHVVYETASPNNGSRRAWRDKNRDAQTQRATPIYIRPPPSRSSGSSRASEGSTYRSSPLGQRSSSSSSNRSSVDSENQSMRISQGDSQGSIVGERGSQDGVRSRTSLLQLRSSSGSGRLRLSSPLAARAGGEQRYSSQGSLKFSMGSIGSQDPDNGNPVESNRSSVV